jgi:hypothetical protein
MFFAFPNDLHCRRYILSNALTACGSSFVPRKSISDAYNNDEINEQLLCDRLRIYVYLPLSNIVRSLFTVVAPPEILSTKLEV